MLGHCLCKNIFMISGERRKKVHAAIKPIGSMYFTQRLRLKASGQAIKAALFGQPSAGFFFDSDFFTASRHLPGNLSISGLGPGVAFFFTAFLGNNIVSKIKV
jgi:hypothetical protein